MELMKIANMIKFNEEELNEIIFHFRGPKEGIEKQLHFIAEKTQTTRICVTQGSKGAMLYDKGRFIHQSGFQITVSDTVGAGDSFLATLMEGFINERPIKETLKRACAMGALVASKKGASPSITEKELDLFIAKKA